jgi:hypothetical protein
MGIICVIEKKIKKKKRKRKRKKIKPYQQQRED